MAKKKTRSVKLYTRWPDRFLRVKFSDAKRAVDVVITADDFDAAVDDAKRGHPWECVLALGVLRAARRNPELFPHPVIHNHVNRRSFYAIDKVNGQPTHSVRYQHDFSHLTYAFDTMTKAAFRKTFGQRGLRLRLRPVKKRGGDELPGARETRVRVRDQTHSVGAGTSRGAGRRAEDAGFGVPNYAPSIVPTVPRSEPYKQPSEPAIAKHEKEKLS